ncbi:MAG: hypothetical protein M3Z01_00315, partial [Thermoproteota archaeon]|nr:hypothetical protein [Thermoproteota archaeon]
MSPPEPLTDYVGERTIVLYEPKEMINAVLENFSHLRKTMCICCDNDGFAVTINAKPIWEGIIALKNRGAKIRWISDITEENLHYCREIMSVAEIRHLDGIKGAFGVHDEKYYYASANVIKEGRTLPGELITSTVKV